MNISDQLDKADLKVSGMLALVNYMQQSFDDRAENCIDPNESITNIILAGYGHEAALSNANNGLIGLTENLKEIRELLKDANGAILKAGK
ncbi:hypothetical protein [Latilactobacillus curvatus]|uniref:hypothetical protein n=1 Tax=Latilactobacillus curvatus TaxID=28038 RepID=UPI000FECDDB6|nr:hypothetical protein [Latilactobacillus curvatus]QAR34607.1 hypothetical protein EQK21_00405 [Latilactobacillus curvatus]